MKKTLLIFLLFIISSSSFSKEKNAELDLYDLGSVLSRCSGDYEFGSILYKELFKNDAVSKTLHEHANGWRMAGVSNYYFSGLTREASKVSAEGKQEARVAQWIADMSLLEKDNIKEFEAFIDELWVRIKYCSSWDDTVVQSQKKLKKAWLSRPKVEDFWKTRQLSLNPTPYLHHKPQSQF